ncbi:MAG TPA: Uma2 family endonuclease [Urbifossiella sp.]|nr:Uma2 family endonuclease [Urbifossiella sp.]
MTTATLAAPAVTPPPAVPATPVTYGRDPSTARFTVAQYERMVDLGILDDRSAVELLEGYVVLKMPQNPPHSVCVQRVNRVLLRAVPAGWDFRPQSPIRLADSEPEPDFAVVRGTADDYAARHPEPADIGLLIEISNTSLLRDTTDKARVYATSGVVAYWVVDVVNRLVIAYRQPAPGGYAARDQFGPADAVPFELDGRRVADVPAADLLG